MIDEIGRDTGSEWCNSAAHTCQKLFIPPSNSLGLDQCLKFGLFIDRNSRQRPIRCDACKEETKHGHE